jgi:hypothetical protein
MTKNICLSGMISHLPPLRGFILFRGIFYNHYTPFGVSKTNPVASKLDSLYVHYLKILLSGYHQLLHFTQLHLTFIEKQNASSDYREEFIYCPQPINLFNYETPAKRATD